MTQITDDEEEVWKTYLNYPFIEASNLGRIRTKDRYVKVKGQSKRLIKGRVLKQQPQKGGYMLVHFRVGGKNVYLYVHRIVATCFIPNPDNLPEVNHKNNNPKNNIVSNLEWCTSQYNTDYREKYGVSAKVFTRKSRKPVIAINLDSFEVFWFESQSEASRQLEANQGHVTDVVNGKQNKTKGCWFCYADKTAVEKTREKFGNEVAKEVEKLINDVT